MSAIQSLTLANGPLRFRRERGVPGLWRYAYTAFPDTLRTFDALLPALAAAGFRGVAVAMRGYEPQSQPADGDYNAVRMAEDVAAWIEQLGGGSAHLIGHDWGATVAFAAAAVVPEQVASMTMLAVPHPVRFAEAYAGDAAQQARSQYILEFQAPGAEQAVVADDCAWLERLRRAWSPGWDIPGHTLADMRATFARPGVAQATLGWYRQAFDTASAAGIATRALLTRPIGVPTLGLVGEDDGCIGADIFAAAMQRGDFPAGLEVRRVALAGHFLHRERPAEVNRLITDWLGRR